MEGPHVPASLFHFFCFSFTIFIRQKKGRPTITSPTHHLTEAPTPPYRSSRQHHLTEAPDNTNLQKLWTFWKEAPDVPERSSIQLMLFMEEVSFPLTWILLLFDLLCPFSLPQSV